MKEKYKLVKTQCIKCSEQAERIAILHQGFIIGFMGNSCDHFGLKEKAKRKDIKYNRLL